MSERRKVPVAYVTKWATTRGILVVKGADGWTTDGEEYLTGRESGSGLFVAPAHWTEDKDKAELRYRAVLLKASQAAFKKHKALVAAINAPPKYTEES
jgi:hypothetical protein